MHVSSLLFLYLASQEFLDQSCKDNLYTRAMELKEWIRAARQSARLTQEQLGEAMGLTKGNVSAWENGRHEASHDQLVRIASVTGYAVPLPGLDGLESSNVARWPFRTVSEDKVRRMDHDDLVRLEAALAIAAAQLGLDIKQEN